MLKYVSGDVFLSPENTVICHQVNTFGTMGKGIALTVKTKYPKVFTKYVEFIQDTISIPYGEVQYCEIDKDRVIANLFSQVGWKTDYKYLELCLKKLTQVPSRYTFSIPYKMSCGLAAGNWEIVEKMIENILGERATIYKFDDFRY